MYNKDQCTPGAVKNMRNSLTESPYLPKHSMEIRHRVKSISLGIFSAEELKALAAGGNKVCVELMITIVLFINSIRDA